MADESDVLSKVRSSRALVWTKSKLAPRTRVIDVISAGGLWLFVATLGAGTIMESWSPAASEAWVLVPQIAVGCAVGLILLGAALRWVALEPMVPSSPSRRLRDLKVGLEGLDETLRQLVAEVDTMGRNAETLEGRLEETQRLLGLSEAERAAIFRELDRRDRASTRQNLLLFVAGVGAGILTNVFIN